jgi:hypothetical protein
MSWRQDLAKAAWAVLKDFGPELGRAFTPVWAVAIPIALFMALFYALLSWSGGRLS